MRGTECAWTPGGGCKILVRAPVPEWAILDVSGEQDMKLKVAIAAAAIPAAAMTAAAQDAETYSTEVPNLSQCIERAGADGEATQVELDACISANMNEVRAAMPELPMDAAGETSYPVSNAMTDAAETGGTEEES